MQSGKGSGSVLDALGAVKLKPHLWRLAETEALDVQADAGLDRLSTLRIGGSAEWLVHAHTDHSLIALIELVKAHGARFHLVGQGSNVLFPDEGMTGVVCRLDGDFSSYRIDGTRVVAGGALSLARLARATASSGLCGLEALAGFPSTVGGAVYMNAGCYGTEIRDVLVQASLVQLDGVRRTITVAELGAGYRSTALQGTGAIVTEAVFELQPGDGDAALKRMNELNQRRRLSLPSGKPNAGSVFKNPEGDYAGRLIEACGLKGRVLGGAAISDKHANVIVNQDGARATDVLGLMAIAYRQVLERFEVALEPELVLAGDLARRWRECSNRRASRRDPVNAALVERALRYNDRFGGGVRIVPKSLFFSFMGLVATMLVVACSPGSPEARVERARSQYQAELRAFRVDEVPTVEDTEVEDTEGQDMEGEDAEDEDTEGGEDPAELASVPKSTSVLLNLLVMSQSSEALPGLTLDVLHVDAAENEKGRYRVWIETESLLKGSSIQVSKRIEEVSDFAADDKFAVEIRSSVPEAERGLYKEFQTP